MNLWEFVNHKTNHRTQNWHQNYFWTGSCQGLPQEDIFFVYRYELEIKRGLVRFEFFMLQVYVGEIRKVAFCLNFFLLFIETNHRSNISPPPWNHELINPTVISFSYNRGWLLALTSTCTCLGVLTMHVTSRILPWYTWTSGLFYFVEIDWSNTIFHLVEGGRSSSYFRG